jgi:hypothetical protein
MKILGLRMLTWIKFRTEEPNLLSATVQISVAWANCCPRWCISILSSYFCIHGFIALILQIQFII